jgi:Tol biopolymer transport system component
MAATLLPACNTNQDDASDTVIGKATLEVKDGLMTPEILHLFGQVSGTRISPDGHTVLYGVSYGDIALNKRNRELFTVNIDGSDKQQITHSAKSEGSEQWINGGERIAFLYDSQLWEMNADGSDRKQISHYEAGIEDFKIAPDGRKVLFISTVKSVETATDKYAD